MFSAAIISARSVIDSLTDGFAPAYPFGLQKNTAGLVIALAFITPTVAPRLLRLSSGWLALVRVLLLLGLLSTQSREAMIALAAMIVLWGARSMRRQTHSRMVIAVVAVGVVGLVFVNEREADRVSTNPNAADFTGEAVRKKINDVAVDHWQTTSSTEPDCATSASRSSRVAQRRRSAARRGNRRPPGTHPPPGSSVPGAARRGGPLATVKRLALGVRVLAAMFDIYWVAGSGSLPWVLVGMALAAEEHTEPTPQPAPPRAHHGPIAMRVFASTTRRS